MIRILVGSAIPVLGLGAATALLGPDLVTGPRGAPLVVAAPPAAAFQEASFDGTGCALPLVLHGEEEGPAEAVKQGTRTRMVTLAFGRGPGGAWVEVQRGSTNTDAEIAAVLVFDGEGRIVAVTYPPTQRDMAEADSVGCATSRSATPATGI